jgi:hypothetical protein
MLQIGSNRQRFQGFIGKLLGEDASEALAEFFAAEIARRGLEVPADEFQTVGLAAAKVFHG